MAGKRRHKWGPHPDAPHRPLHVQKCSECGMSRTDYAEQGLRWEYRDTDWRFVAQKPQKWPAPPCPGRPEEKRP